MIMDSATVQWINWLLVAASLGLGVFNTRAILQNAKRERDKALPTVEVEVSPGLDGQTIDVSLTYPLGPTVRWVPKTAKLLKPRGGKIVNPMTLLSFNDDNEPWAPSGGDIEWEAHGESATLQVKDRPGYEAITVWVPQRGGPVSLVIDLEFVSVEAQPRTHRITLKRKITTLIPSIMN